MSSLTVLLNFVVRLLPVAGFLVVSWAYCFIQGFSLACVCVCVCVCEHGHMCVCVFVHAFVYVLAVHCWFRLSHTVKDRAMQSIHCGCMHTHTHSGEILRELVASWLIQHFFLFFFFFFSTCSVSPYLPSPAFFFTHSHRFSNKIVWEDAWWGKLSLDFLKFFVLFYCIVLFFRKFLQELQDCKDYPAKVGRCFINRVSIFLIACLVSLWVVGLVCFCFAFGQCESGDRWEDGWWW